MAHPTDPILIPFNGILPRIHKTAFIAPGAIIIGDVEIGADSSIWFGCVLRGDVNAIRIGERTNIQDGCVVHVAVEGKGTQVGNDVTVGHMALLHGCIIKDHAFVGMKSGVMDGAVIESYGILAAGALLTPGKVILEGQLWTGTSAKYWRSPFGEDKDLFASRAEQYVSLSRSYIK